MNRRDRTQPLPESRPRETVHTRQHSDRPKPVQCRCGGYFTNDQEGRGEHQAVFGHAPIGGVP